MALLFKSVLYASFMGSIVAIILLLLKAVFKDKLKASWHYCIWFFLIIRLILPYAPESRVSIYNLFPHVTQSIHLSQIDKIPETDVKTYMENAPVQSSANIQDMDSGTNKPEMGQTLIKSTTIEKYSLDNYINIISIVWIVVAGIMLLYIFVLNMGFYLIIGKNAFCMDKSTLDILEECKSLLNVKTSIPIIYYRDNKPPFLLGIFKPKLIVPNILFDKLSEQEKRHIFLHEIAHFKRKDILVNSIMLVVKSIHWFNPIIWYACRRMQEDCEIACDARVLSCLKPEEYKKYGETAINLLMKFTRPYLIPSTAGISGNGSGIKRRIHMITRFKKNSIVWTMVSIILFLTVGFVGLTNSNMRSGLIPLEKLANEASTVVDAEGEGIVVTVSVNTDFRSETNQIVRMFGAIHDSSLRSIVTELRMAGAYAISINDIRLTKYSQIKAGDFSTIIDGNEVKPPYTIKTLGNSDIMEKALGNKRNNSIVKTYNDIEIKQMQNIQVSKQGEDERKLNEARAEAAKAIDLVISPEESTNFVPKEVSDFKEYWTFGLYNFWVSPYLIYNDERYEILVRDSVPEREAGKVLGSTKSYINPASFDLFHNKVNIASFIHSEGYSNYLRQGAKIYKLKWNSDSKVILVDDNGVLKRAVIVKK